MQTRLVLVFIILPSGTNQLSITTLRTTTPFTPLFCRFERTIGGAKALNHLVRRSIENIGANLRKTEMEDINADRNQSTVFRATHT